MAASVWMCVNGWMLTCKCERALRGRQDWKTTAVHFYFIIWIRHWKRNFSIALFRQKTPVLNFQAALSTWNFSCTCKFLMYITYILTITGRLHSSVKKSWNASAHSLWMGWRHFPSLFAEMHCGQASGDSQDFQDSKLNNVQLLKLRWKRQPIKSRVRKSGSSSSSQSNGAYAGRDSIFPHIPKNGGEISGSESITRCFMTRPTGI